jgi:hypothetical protein
MDTSQNNGPWTMTQGEFEESVRKVELAVTKRGGNPRQLFDRIRTDASFTDRIAEFMLRGGLDGSVHHDLAHAVMGKNFFGVGEWSALYGVNFSKKQLREVAEFPWGEDILNAPCPFVKGKSIRETHFAFLGLDAVGGKSLTIIKWQELHPASGQPRFYSYAPDNWYANEKFGNTPTCGFRWYLMPLEIVPNSTDKTYQGQVSMLSAEYEVPFAVEEVSKDLLYHRKNGVYLNPQRYGRCQDVTSVGRRVYVGYSGTGGLGVDRWSDGGCYYDIGLAASRKFRTLKS